MNLSNCLIDDQLFTEFQGQTVANSTHFSHRKDTQFTLYIGAFFAKKHGRSPSFHASPPGLKIQKAHIKSQLDRSLYPRAVL